MPRPLAKNRQTSDGPSFTMPTAESAKTGSTVSRSRRFAFVAVSVLLGTLFAIGAAELAIRLIAKPTATGPKVRGTLLQPHDWDALRTHMKSVWDKSSGELSYLVYDPQLGWTLGANRRSANGLYFSGPEGIRSPRVGESFATREPLRRIAIVGDSFAFGEEVKYEDTFPAKLQETLGQEFQVLNFAVPGYSVGQAYRRYVKDVLRWNPEIVILAFISHDLNRSLSVYTFINFPSWDMPFSKPRAVVSADGIDTWVNVPTLKPDAMFNHSRVSELPNLELDVGYEADQWSDKPWDFSYLVRWLDSRLTSVQRQDNVEKVKAEIFRVNRAIVRDFVKVARERGSIPIVVYLPGGLDFDSSRASALDILGPPVLRSADIDYFDTTPCLSAVDPSERFTPQNPHYSPLANAAVGRCLGDHIRHALDERASAFSTDGTKRAELGL